MGLDPLYPTVVISCARCGWSGETRTAQLTAAGQHLKASCVDCGSYIKFVPHSASCMPFGKYRGVALTAVAARDPEYLQWALRLPDLRGNLRQQIERVMHLAESGAL